MTKTTSGFTIVELLIVIVIIAILTAIGILGYNGIQNRTNDAAIQSDVRQTYTNVQNFYTINGAYPTTWAEVNQTFVATRKSNGGGINTYLYCRSADSFAIVIRSVSGNGFYYSSVNGVGKYALWPGDSNANLCPPIGIPTTSTGYTFMWMRVNGAWDPAFTPGA